MKITTWNAIKTILDNDQTMIAFYKIEKSYSSNLQELPDEYRYFIYLNMAKDALYCFVDKKNIAQDPSDQKTFETNYIPLSRVINV